MSTLGIILDGDQTGFAPGEAITGTVDWVVETPPKRAAVSLVYCTEGKGDQDVGVAETIQFDHPAASAQHAFEFVAPDGPFSFSGRLISLTWAIELEIEPGGRIERQEVVIAPRGEEIALGSAKGETPKGKKRWLRFESNP